MHWVLCPLDLGGHEGPIMLGAVLFLAVPCALRIRFWGMSPQPQKHLSGLSEG